MPGMETESAIEARGLTKLYGRIRGIEDLTLQVARGEVFGFLGPNGAGKTTTIRLLLNLLTPTRGSARVLGLDVVRESIAVRRRCGVVSGEPAFFDSMTGRKHLAMVQGLHGDSRERGLELAERLALDLDRPVRAYSRGMKQKLAIAQALAHGPEVLVLDEPTLGLDPLMQREFYSLLAEEKARGVTVFLSSHILSEVERVCDRVGIVRGGFLVAVLDVADLHHRRVRRMYVTLEREARPGDFQVEGVEVVRCDGRSAELRVSGNVAEVVRHLATLPLADVVFPEASLEETFTEFYSGQETVP